MIAGQIYKRKSYGNKMPEKIPRSPSRTAGVQKNRISDRPREMSSFPQASLYDAFRASTDQFAQ
jgi:hypothetical protein